MRDRNEVVFDAIEQAPNLRSGLVDTLAAQIEAGELAPGQRLPAEQEIVNATGVSRTVVREALASLRARGLIVTRQGLGAFVAKDLPPKTYSIVPTDLESIDAVMRVLELRIGVETEAAALAAERRTDADLAAMTEALEAITRSIRSGGTGSEEDLNFHRAISKATANPNFTRLFDTFGSALIPRQWARFDQMTERQRENHADRMQDEHQTILAAIAAGDPNAARRAMRMHLTRSYRRFETLRDKTAQADTRAP
jgi:GntR family transcriptional repressor for pyruvate dehydrogenase complex